MKHTTTILRESIEAGQFQGKDLLKAISLLDKLRKRTNRKKKSKVPSAVAEFRTRYGIGDDQ